MPTEFTMPKLGLTMEEGTILEWLVPDGAEVRAGTAVLLVETDKVETEVEIPDGGRLQVVGVVGEAYRCGERIGWVLGAGEVVPAGSVSVAVVPAVGADSAGVVSAAPAVAVLPAVGAESPVGGGAVAVVGAMAVSAAPVGPAGRLFASPFARKRASELGVEIGSVSGTGPSGRIVSEDVEAAHEALVAAPSTAAVSVDAGAPVALPTPAAVSGPVSIPPARRRVAPPATFAAAELARLVGIDLSTTPILPTAADGRISREDVANHVRSLLGATSRPAIVYAPLTQEPTSMVPLKGMRGTIANRMRASLQDMAQLTLMMDADMDAVVADRDLRKGGASVPGYTDYVVAAAARALRDHPRVNSQVTANGVALLARVNVGVAVALEEGLLVPVVNDADSLDLESLSEQTTKLADAARAGKLKLADLEGGTFSVSALGMFGVDGFTPVINPPNVAILGVGRLRDDVAWSADGAIRRVKRLTLSLTWDHRAFDGAPAAEFVRTVCRYLDDPSTLA